MASKRATYPNTRGTQYARNVASGKIVAGPWVRLACERHLRDLREGSKRGLRFDVERAERAMRFFETQLAFPDGPLAGEPFRLLPFQAFIVESVEGWRDAGGYRRFRTAYVEIGKGNGKSPLAGGLGLLGLVSGPFGAEIYAAATTREQASILFDDAKAMVEASPRLQRVVDVGAANLAFLRNGSYFRPVSSEHRGLDGKRVYLAALDEIHEHASPVVVNKMRAGTKAHRDALIFEITNSGYDRTSICWQHHDFSLKVLQEVIDNDAWFAYVCALDDGDDHRDETVWVKANPGLDEILPREYLREQVAEAAGMPQNLNIVLRLNFCVWTEAADRWMDLEAWDECGTLERVDVDALRGRSCYLGIDLSSTTDFSALVANFPPAEEGERWKQLEFYWIPAEKVRFHVERDQVPCDYWVREGYITATPGNVVDYDWIRSEVNRLVEAYDVQEVAYDRWGFTGLGTALQEDGVTLVPFGQGFASMSGPTKEFETKVVSRSLAHAANPVTRWMMSNAAAEQDAAGNIKPSKAKSTGRIDGVVAGVMAMGRATLQKETGSIYDEEVVI